MRIILRTFVLAVNCLLLLLFASACNNKNYTYDPGKPFVTNVKNSDKILKCEIVFEITENNIKNCEEKNYIIRDAVNKVLIELTEDEIYENTDLDEIGLRLVDSVNEAMRTSIFYSASFVSFAGT